MFTQALAGFYENEVCLQTFNHVFNILFLFGLITRPETNFHRPRYTIQFQLKQNIHHYTH